MKPKRSRLRRALRWLLVLVVLALFVMFFLLPIVFAVYAIVPAGDDVGAPPEGFDDITLTTDDDVTLAAWFAAPQNGAAIVLVHGSGNSRDDVRAHAELLAGHGFGVLAIDLRGHGESGGDINRLGWHGSRDVGAAVRYLEARDDVNAIGGLGLSVGGEILLGAVGEYPALQAVVSEGATSRWLDEFRALESHRSFIGSLQVRMLDIAVGLFSGDDPPTPMLDSIRAAEGTRLLLISAGNERDEAEFNEVFAEAAGPRAETWVVPDSGHTQGLIDEPAQYEQRVIGFFEAALLAAE